MSGQYLGEVGGRSGMQTVAVNVPCEQVIRDRSPIDLAIDEIDSAIESLTYELNELGNRMSPVLRPQGSGAQSGSASPDMPAKPGIVMPSPIEERLQTLSRRLRMMAAATATTRNSLTI